MEREVHESQRKARKANRDLKKKKEKKKEKTKKRDSLELCKHKAEDTD